MLGNKFTKSNKVLGNKFSNTQYNLGNKFSKSLGNSEATIKSSSSTIPDTTLDIQEPLGLKKYHFANKKSSLERR